MGAFAKELIESAVRRVVDNAHRQVLADSVERTPEREARLLKLVNEGVAQLRANLREQGFDLQVEVQNGNAR